MSQQNGELLKLQAKQVGEPGVAPCVGGLLCSVCGFLNAWQHLCDAAEQTAGLFKVWWEGVATESCVVGPHILSPHRNALCCRPSRKKPAATGN